MAAYGSMGGMGGMRPTPNSQVVDYMPSAADWSADWQRRYDEEASLAGTPEPLQSVNLMPGSERYAANNWEKLGLSADPYNTNYVQLPAALKGAGQSWADVVSAPGFDLNQNAFWGTPGGVDAMSRIILAEKIKADPSVIDANGRILTFQNKAGDLTEADRAMLGISSSMPQDTRWSIGKPGDQGFSVAQSRPYNPNFTQLNAEKAQMLPLLEQQTRGQQAYAIQNGNNMLNGVLDPNAYTQEGYGQVTGDFGQASLGAGANPGVDMSFTAAADPSMSDNGVYTPNASTARPWWVPSTSGRGFETSINRFSL